MPATEDANRTIGDLPEPLLRKVIDHLPKPDEQRMREQQLSSLQRINRAFRQATQDSFRGEPHAGARRERIAVAARDILQRPDLDGTEQFRILTALFGKSKDIGLNLAHAPDASRLTILLDALSARDGLRTLHINASNMGSHFKTAIAQLLPIIAGNSGMTECSIDVRDNDRGEEAAVLIRRQLERSDLAGSVLS